MRRLFALAAVATIASLPLPADASYACLPEDSSTAVCVQIAECTDLCFIAPGVRFDCYLGFRGETVCRVVRALGFEVGGR